MAIFFAHMGFFLYFCSPFLGRVRKCMSAVLNK